MKKTLKLGLSYLFSEHLLPITIVFDGTLLPNDNKPFYPYIYYFGIQ